MVRREALDGVGVQFSLGTKDKHVVLVGLELEVQLKPQPEVEEDAVASVADAKENLCRGVPLFCTIICPTEPCCDSKIGILGKYLRSVSCDLCPVFHPHNHV